MAFVCHIHGEAGLAHLCEHIHGAIEAKAPVPSWGNLAADGLAELNPYRSHWWLLLFPCVLLAGTLLSLSLIGEWLRARLDPKSRERAA